MIKTIDGKEVELIVQLCEKCAFSDKDGNCTTENMECFDLENHDKSWKEVSND